MTDTLSPKARSQRMARVGGKNTKTELRVRRLLHRPGYRYRLHDADLPGKPDLVFRGRKKVIFVHGCFWHRHESTNCKLARLPKSRLDFWLPKLQGNASRDKLTVARLQEQGWGVLTIWECELSEDSTVLARVAEFLK